MLEAYRKCNGRVKVVLSSRNLKSRVGERVHLATRLVLSSFWLLPLRDLLPREVSMETSELGWCYARYPTLRMVEIMSTTRLITENAKYLLTSARLTRIIPRVNF